MSDKANPCEVQDINQLRNDALREAFNALMRAQVASCTCMTKIPDVNYHGATCLYARLVELCRSVEEIGVEVGALNFDATPLGANVI